MIKYNLVCGNAHEFESWFPDSDGFDAQARRGLVACPECNSVQVRKAIMSPSVARRDRPTSSSPQAVPVATEEPSAAQTKAPQPVVLLDERQMALQAVLRHLHAEVMKQTDDVGRKFPEEARRMHEGDIPHRSIRGEASLQEAKDLMEEGIEIMPVPRLPDDWN
jgi:hypothetical protein